MLPTMDLGMLCRVATSLQLAALQLLNDHELLVKCDYLMFSSEAQLFELPITDDWIIKIPL